MSKSLKTRLKVSAIAAVTTIAVSGVFAIAPQLVKAVTIDELMAQIANLQAELKALQGGGSASTGTGTGLKLTSVIEPGSRGQNVTDLQTALKTDSSVYPEGLVTGFYGSLTTKAVQRFQAKYSIVSSGTPSTTGYGRVGPRTMAKLNEVFGGTSTAGGTGTGGTGTGGTGGTTGTTTTTTTAGSGLTVSAATQPSETLAPESAARLPFVKITLTAANDGDVTVKSLTIRRDGLGDDAVFAGVLLLDEDGTQIGLEKTLNSNHQTSLNQAFVVKKGTSKTLTVAGNMATSLDSYAGQVVKLTVVAVDAGSAAVAGSLPISGNGMTVNGTLTLGSATITRGAMDPGSDATKEVGTTAYTFASVKLTAGSSEDLLLKSMRWDQTGSVSDSDMKNLKIVVGSTAYDVKTDGKKYWATFGDGVTVTKGSSADLAVKGDIDGGSNRTISFDVEKKTDIVVLGKLYGYYVTVSGGSTGAASDGSFSSNLEPFYNSYDVTVNTGTLRVEKSNVISAGNVPISVENAELGAYTFEAKGEPVMISAITVSGASSTNVTSVSIYDSSGAVMAGPKDASSAGAVAFTDTWTVPVGVSVYKIKGKLSTNFSSGETIALSITPSNITAKGEITGKAITPTPSSAIAANTQTVRAANLRVSVASSPVAQTVVRGVNGFLFAKIQFDGSNSGEDVRITSQAITDTVSAAGRGDEVNNCQMFDGTTALNTGSNVVNPTDTTDTTNEQTYTFDTHLIVPKGQSKVVDLKCNISGSATDASTHQFGIASGQETVVTGISTGVSVSEVLTAATGQQMTITTGGSFTISRDNSSPTERWGVAGTVDNVATVFKLHATNEALKLDKILLSFSSSTASTTDFTINDSKVSLYDGAVKVGTAVFSSSGTVATSTLDGSFIIPKDGDRLLTAKIDLANVGTSQNGQPGRLIAINFDGTGTTSTTAIGQSSGSSFNVTTASDVNGNGIRLTKAYPTLARLAIPSNTLTNGSMTLYRFSVTAPSAGDVGLYKFTFSVSSSSLSTSNATTSNFYVYGYNDSAFSVTAYNNNPLNASAAAKVGSTTQVSTQNALGASSPAGYASTTEVVIYFDPLTKTATAPNAEAIAVPAGTTRYFELKATLSGVATGDGITVSLLGDNAYFTRSTNRFLETANTVDAQSPTNNFVWSPNTTSTAATTTPDWVNGFEVPGLPSTNMEAQSFSR